MQTTEPTLKTSAKVALAAMAVLLVGSMVFYKERILFADSAFKTFNILRNDRFDIDLMRYGSFVSQLFPYLAQKCHLPVKVILIGYSVSFNLFYCLVALLLYRTREYKLAVLMACYFFLIVSDSYYWPNDELHQAVGWMFVLLGTALYMGRRKANLALVLPVFLLLSFLTVFTHFVVILPLGFLWGYLWMEKTNWPFTRSVSVTLTAILIAVVALKYMLTASQSYDGPQLHNATHFSAKDIAASFSTSVVRTFLSRCVTNYWPATVLFIVGLVALFRQNKLLLIYAVVSWVGYMILIGLTYATFFDHPHNIYLFHIETEWASIGILMAAPFIFSVLPRLRPSVAAAMLVVVFITRLVYIGAAAPRFTWRTTDREELLTKMRKAGITKVALHRKSEISDKYVLDWAFPYECMLNSIMDNDQARTAFFFNKEDSALVKATSDPKAFFNVWDIQKWHDQDRYFSLDTTRGYQVMSYDELMK